MGGRLFRAGLMLEAVLSLVTALLCLTAVNAFSFLYPGSFYPFTLPAIAIALFCFASSAAGLADAGRRERWFWSVVAVGPFMTVAHGYALYRWPGGDDGPGMFWGLFVGAGSALMSTASACLLVWGWVAKVRSRRDT